MSGLFLRNKQLVSVIMATPTGSKNLLMINLINQYPFLGGLTNIFLLPQALLPGLEQGIEFILNFPGNAILYNYIAPIITCGYVIGQLLDRQ